MLVVPQGDSVSAGDRPRSVMPMSSSSVSHAAGSVMLMKCKAVPKVSLFR